MLELIAFLVSSGERVANALFPWFGLPSGDINSSSDAVTLAIFSAVIAGIAFVFKSIATAWLAYRDEGRRFRSSIIRYVYDADIWMNDFEKNFSWDKVDYYRNLLFEGDNDFKFSLTMSKDEDSGIMEYIHRLRAHEIYAIRQFLAYVNLFDAMCQQLSSDEFAGIDKTRKLNGFIDTIAVGEQTYGYAVSSLEEIRTPLKSALLKYVQNTVSFLFGLILPHQRRYISLDRTAPKYKKPKPVYNHPWSDASLAVFKAESESKLDDILHQRG